MKAALILSALLASFTLTLAADTDATAAAKEQITKRSADYAGAWAKHDPKAIAAFYTQDADLVIASGETFISRDGIEHAMAEWFDSVIKDTTIEERIEKVR